MANANTRPLTPATEFAERIIGAINVLDIVRYQNPTPEKHVRVAAKIQGLNTALNLLAGLTDTGTKEGAALVEAYITFEHDLKELEAAAHDGEKEGYGLVLDYLRGVGY